MKNLILYIIKFEEAEFLKIGITTNLLSRIDQINNAVVKEINFKESIIIDSDKNSDIRLLEKNLLRISEKERFELKSHSKVNGATEFRKCNCFEDLINFIELQKDFKIRYRIYNGIDISGNYTHNFPKAYFPPNIKTDGISFVLMDDLKNYCEKKKINIKKFYNQLLFDKAKELGIDRKDNDEDDLSNAFQV